MLTKHQKDYILQLIQEGKELPEDFKYLLFPTTQKEYELVYAGKMRKEDLIANEDGAFPVPLQLEKVFNGNEHEAFKDGWKNMIVFGDNLQFLKTVYENKDPLIRDKVKGKIKLIYIDPPFATASDFKGSQGQKAYTDKIKGAEFVEFLRRRLLIARELLSDDGNIFVHLDFKMSHYIKILLDEIFGSSNFKNEIIWRRTYAGKTIARNIPSNTDFILWYSKTENYYFNPIVKPLSVEDKESFKKNDQDERGFYSTVSMQKVAGPTKGTVYDYVDNMGRVWKCPAKGWRMVFEKMKALENDNRLYFGGKTVREKYYLIEREVIGKQVDNLWTDIGNMNRNKTEDLGYPTQKPEELIERIIKATTSENDIVLDFFGGSGTTAGVAEKLCRKWIACDIGKLSYFTMQKRILQIQNTKELNESKNKYNKKAKSFMTCTLGLYDLKKALDLEWKKYQEFVSGIFEIQIKPHKIAGFEFDGKRGSYPVKIWDYNKHKNSSVDEKYLKSIHQTVGSKISGRVYIIAPANNIDFLTDYHEIDGLRYYFLKIPYQVIKDLHKMPFQKLRQPQSRKNVNDIDETIGFHFIKQPEVKSKLQKLKGEVSIVIKEFKSQYHKDEEGKVLENFETLSAVFVDKNFDGKQFIMTDYYFADDLLPKKKSKKNTEDDEENEDIRKELKKMQKDGLKITFEKSELGKKIMVVYTDIYGNDFSEILTV